MSPLCQTIICARHWWLNILWYWNVYSSVYRNRFGVGVAILHWVALYSIASVSFRADLDAVSQLHLLFSHGCGHCGYLTIIGSVTVWPDCACCVTKSCEWRLAWWLVSRSGTSSPVSTGIGDDIWRVYTIPVFIQTILAYSSWPSLRG